MSVQLMWCKNTVLLFLLLGISCGKVNKFQDENKVSSKNLKIVATDDADDVTLNQVETIETIVIGANQTEVYLELLEEKRVGVVANQTSVIFKDEVGSSESSVNTMYIHLVDSLISHKINVKKIFAPEHGFRGKADAGEVVKHGLDTKTGLPIISLYGNNKKPAAAQLKGLDVVVFDIQDVGARFYTYISTLHYVMEACAEAKIPIIILDRPNPNGHYVDGPILESEHKSFIGMHPVPVVHGMTIAEYAKMINGEGWLSNNITCELTIIKVKNYTHKSEYNLPIKPSPNLPNDIAVNLYPSLCFFEGTNVSVGRGTELQFQIYGSPFLPKTEFNFTPRPNFGAKYPKHENKVCNGYNLRASQKLDRLDLSFIINAYNITKDKSSFFLSNGFFTKLAGTKKLQKQIEAGVTIENIKATWKDGLNTFNIMRAKYLLYN